MPDRVQLPKRLPPAPPDDPRRYVYVDRPRCPYCNSLKVKCQKTMPREDESVTRYTYCRDCGHTFYLVAE